MEEYWSFEDIPNFDIELVGTKLKHLLLNQNLGLIWIVTNEDVAVGYLLVVYVFSLEYLGIAAEIDEFFLLSSQRGNGIGAKLLMTVEAELLRNKCTNVSLQLSRNNESARAFYYSNGYSDRTKYELLSKSLSRD